MTCNQNQPWWNKPRRLGTVVRLNNARVLYYIKNYRQWIAALASWNRRNIAARVGFILGAVRDNIGHVVSYSLSHLKSPVTESEIGRQTFVLLSYRAGWSMFNALLRMNSFSSSPVFTSSSYARTLIGARILGSWTCINRSSRRLLEVLR